MNYKLKLKSKGYFKNYHRWFSLGKNIAMNILSLSVVMTWEKLLRDQ